MILGTGMERLKTLIIKAKMGNLDAYGQVVRRFQDMAFGYAYARLGDFHLAQDVCQEAFMEAFRQLAKLSDPEAFPGWFRRIVSSQCTAITRRKKIPTVSLNKLADIAAKEKFPSDTAECREMEEKILQAVQTLPGHQRTATTLYYINGYSQADIAGFLEVPLTTVQKRLHDERTRLKERVITMVKETLKTKTPPRDETSDKVTFLLKIVRLLEQGVPVLNIFEKLAREVKTKQLRQAIRQLNIDLTMNRCSISESLAKHPSLFPRMVLWLIDLGEKLGELDVTLKMAGEWLQKGSFQVNPYAFINASHFLLRQTLKKGLEAGAKEIIIDGGRFAPLPNIEPKVDKIWTEIVKPDGTREKDQPLCPPKHLASYSATLKAETILDKHQKEEALAGRLQIRIKSEDEKETLFPIRFQPDKNGEVITIQLTCL